MRVRPTPTAAAPRTGIANSATICKNIRMHIHPQLCPRLCSLAPASGPKPVAPPAISPCTTSAEKGAPVIMHPSYKTVRQETRGQRKRGSCVAIVDMDGSTPLFCDGPCVGGVSTQHQLCFDHLHAPVIYKENPQQQRTGRLVRYCQKNGCQRLLPLERFQGFSPVCMDHPDGRVADGGAPVVGSTGAQHESIGVVLTDAVRLKTLVAGGHGGPDILRMKVCDAVGCKKAALQTNFVCADHKKVWSRPFHATPLSQRPLVALRRRFSRCGARSSAMHVRVVVLARLAYPHCWPSCPQRQRSFHRPVVFAGPVPRRKQDAQFGVLQMPPAERT